MDNGEATNLAAPPITRDYLADVVFLSAAQLQSSIDYAGSQERQCTDSMVRVLGGVALTRDTLSGANGSQLIDAFLPTIDEALRQVAEDANEAIVALQFVDALGQRLAHILFELRQIASFAESGPNLESADAWKNLLTEIRTMYSIHEERAVFDAVMANAPIGKLIDLDHGSGDRAADLDELF